MRLESEFPLFCWNEITLAQSSLPIIPEYVIQSTRVPTSDCIVANNICRDFISYSTTDHRKIHLISWEHGKVFSVFKMVIMSSFGKILEFGIVTLVVSLPCKCSTLSNGFLCLVLHYGWSWSWEDPNQLLLQDTCEKITLFKPSSNGKSDFTYWNLTTYGNCSLKSAYCIMHSEHPLS